MGKFPISDGIAGKAMRSTGLVGTPDGKPAWIFENQTGVLGNNLNSSVLYMGATGNINVISVAGTRLASVSTLNLIILVILRLTALTTYSSVPK